MVHNWKRLLNYDLKRNEDYEYFFMLHMQEHMKLKRNKYYTGFLIKSYYICTRFINKQRLKKLYPTHSEHQHIQSQRPQLHQFRWMHLFYQRIRRKVAAAPKKRH